MGTPTAIWQDAPGTLPEPVLHPEPLRDPIRYRLLQGGLFTAILKRALTRGFAGRHVACA